MFKFNCWFMYTYDKGIFNMILKLRILFIGLFCNVRVEVLEIMVCELIML